MPRILVIGGYGAFGSRLAERLAREEDLEIILAGRNRARAEEAAQQLAASAGAKVTGGALDATRVTPQDILAFAPDVVVNASGPFQGQDYQLPRTAIAAGCHYVDIADARAYVTGIGALDAIAQAAGVAVIAGASSVPGLSSAVVAHLAGAFSAIRRIEIAISPGSGFEPGKATAAAALSYLGQPIQVKGRTSGRPLYGWQGLRRLYFPGLGKRWTGYCEVPDLDLFPAAYRDLQHIEFRAGLEVGFYQIGLWALTWPVRLGLIKKPERMAGVLTRFKTRLSFLGSNRGGMRVAVAGLNSAGHPYEAVWSLAAHDGDGLYVPVMGAVILAKRLARGELSFQGAAPCFEMFKLEEFLAEVADLRIDAG